MEPVLNATKDTTFRDLHALSPLKLDPPTLDAPNGTGTIKSALNAHSNSSSMPTNFALLLMTIVQPITVPEHAQLASRVTTSLLGHAFLEILSAKLKLPLDNVLPVILAMSFTRTLVLLSQSWLLLLNTMPNVALKNSWNFKPVEDFDKFITYFAENL